MPKLQIDPADSIFRIISGSILSGASLIFVEEGMTLGAKALFELLKQKLNGKMAFSLVSIQSLLADPSTPRTQLQDVMFLGAIEDAQVEMLARVCACKVVKCETAIWAPSLFDVAWDVNSLPVNQLFNLLDSLCSTDHHITSSQVDARTLARKVSSSVALFLDRDDVIVRNVPYNKDPEKVILMPGICELINRAHENNELVIICSNQSGIGRGLVSNEEYKLVHQRMLKLLSSVGAWVDDCFWSSYIEGSVLKDTALYPQMRKPRPGMFVEAARKWSIDLSNSRMIGDSATDLMAAYHAGVQKLYLLASEKLEDEKKYLTNFQTRIPGLVYKTLPNLNSI